MLTVNPSGVITSLSMLNVTDGVSPVSLGVGQTVDTDQIDVTPFVNPSSGSIVIDADGGNTTGSLSIVFNAAVPSVIITNDSLKNVNIGGIDVFNNENSPPTIMNEGLITNWQPTLDSVSSDLGSSINISSTNAAGGNITIGGSILNPGGPTIISSADGNIVASGPGSISIAGRSPCPRQKVTWAKVRSPIPLEIPVDTQASGGVQVTGWLGVNLAMTAMTTAAGPIVLDVANITAQDGSVDIAVADAEEVTYPGMSGLVSVVPSNSTVDITDIMAGGDINVTAGSTTAVETDVMLDGNIMASDDVNITATGSILSCNSTGPDITANEAELQAAGSIGTIVMPLNLSVSQLEASATGGGIWIDNSGPLVIGQGSSLDGLSAAGPLVVNNNGGSLTVEADILSTAGNINLRSSIRRTLETTSR